MPSLKTVKSENAKFSPSYVPVAVFVGGTSGVGRGIAQAFAKHTKGNANIVIVGRNENAAESIISSFPKPPSPEIKHEFVEADVSLMSNVHTTTSSLLSRYPKINFLFLTPGILSMAGRTDTSEGIDKKLAVHYYARFAFTHDLLPAVKNAAEAGEDARVLSVFAAGTGSKVDLDDLGLKKNYTLERAAGQGASYHDIAFKEFAVQNPSDRLTFTYSYPGFVDTGGAKNISNHLLRFANKAMVIASKPFATSLEDAGEYQLYGMLKYTGGFQRVGSTGDSLGNTKFFGEDEEVRKKVWEHTIEECRITE
ncbi:NAD(P)-binding protein [Flagelloscypha sp. PMI_526]|nr:NAD(P)-binding protein [Flagelloscypha sp. PMI_526]